LDSSSLALADPAVSRLLVLVVSKLSEAPEVLDIPKAL
jgi:hypothetical protein